MPTAFERASVALLLDEPYALAVYGRTGSDQRRTLRSARNGALNHVGFRASHAPSMVHGGSAWESNPPRTY